MATATAKPARPNRNDKALRLIAGQAVRFHRLGVGAAAADVAGDSGDYHVIWNASGWGCDCEAAGHGRECSHIIAARIVYRSVRPALGA